MCCLCKPDLRVMMTRLLRNRFFRAFCALAYTAFMTVVLIQPSADPIIGPPAPPGAPTLEREILLLTGHLVAFAVLTLLWTYTFYATIPLERAVLLAVAIGLAMGILTEMVQSIVPGRGASVFDVAANWFATLTTAWAIRRYATKLTRVVLP